MVSIHFTKICEIGSSLQVGAKINHISKPPPRIFSPSETVHHGQKNDAGGFVISSWWFQHIWKTLVKYWIISPNRWENKNYLKPPTSFSLLTSLSSTYLGSEPGDPTLRHSVLIQLLGILLTDGPVPAGFPGVRIRHEKSWLNRGSLGVQEKCFILLMVQKSCDHQLRLVVYPMIYKVLAPSQVVKDFFHQQ